MTTYLTAGAELPEGTVRGMTLTAYEVETPEGGTVFVPFCRVHPLVPVMPLVVLR